jgi:outer membrane protein assembly factor BamB
VGRGLRSGHAGTASLRWQAAVSGEVLIDLGTRPHREVDDAPVSRRPQPRLLVILVALLAAVLPASAPPGGPRLPLLFSLPVSANPQYFIDAGSLFVASGHSVSAYRLADGALRWRAPVDRDVLFFAANDAAGTLSVELDGGESAIVQVFDRVTGAPLWRRAGVAGDITLGGDTAVFFDAGGSGPDAPEAMSAVGARTGAPRWRRELPDRRTNWAAVTLPGQPLALLGVRVESGILAVRVDLTSGATLGTAELTNGLPELAQAQVRQLAGVIGDALVIAAVTDSGPRVYGFDATTLRLRWSTPLPSYTQYAGDCGPRICLYGDGGTTLLDPRTGAVTAAGDWQYAVFLPDGRLVAQTNVMTVVDDRLHPVLPLGLWQLVSIDPVVLLIQRGLVTDQTWIGVLDAGGQRVRPIGAMRVGSVDSCGTDGSYLVCRARPGLAVFRLT